MLRDRLVCSIHHRRMQQRLSMPWNSNPATRLLTIVLISPPQVDPVPATKAKPPPTRAMPPRTGNVLTVPTTPCPQCGTIDNGLCIAAFDNLLVSPVAKEATSQPCVVASPGHFAILEDTLQHFLTNHQSVVFTNSQPPPPLHCAWTSQSMEHNSRWRWTLVLQPLSSVIHSTKPFGL